jgi:hypothetical protein
VSKDSGAEQSNICLKCTDMTTLLLTEGDLDRGQPPELKAPHWRCGIVDPASAAACTLRPHTNDKQHQGLGAVQGAGRSAGARILDGGCDLRLSGARLGHAAI